MVEEMATDGAADGPPPGEAANPDGQVWAADLTGEGMTEDAPVPAATEALPDGDGPDVALAAQIAALQALPDVIPELVGGATPAAVAASVAQARAAYAAARGRILAAAQAGVPPAHGGAGAAPAPVGVSALDYLLAGVQTGSR